MTIINRPICINSALCSKSKQQPIPWLHGRKTKRPTASWTGCLVLKQMTMTRFFNCQSDTANTIWCCSWGARNVPVTEREGICSWEWHFRKGLRLSHHLWQHVCPSAGWTVELLSFCKTLQGSFKTCRSLWIVFTALWSQRKGLLSVGWELIPRWQFLALENNIADSKHGPKPREAPLEIYEFMPTGWTGTAPCLSCLQYIGYKSNRGWRE